MPSLPEFKNEPLVDFNKAENKSAMEAALRTVANEFGREYPLVIGGKHITGLKTFESINPSHKDQVLGRFSKGSRDHVEQAVDAAWKAFETWKRAPLETRAGLLVKAAALMRERKHEFSAVMVYEVGKTWAVVTALSYVTTLLFTGLLARAAIRVRGQRHLRDRLIAVQTGHRFPDLPRNIDR